MALYAGESVGNVVRVQSAAEVVRELAEGAERLLEAADNDSLTIIANDPRCAASRVIRVQAKLRTKRLSSPTDTSTAGGSPGRSETRASSRFGKSSRSVASKHDNPVF